MESSNERGVLASEKVQMSGDSGIDEESIDFVLREADIPWDVVLSFQLSDESRPQHGVERVAQDNP